MKRRNLIPRALAAILMLYNGNVGAESPEGVMRWNSLKAEIVKIFGEVDPAKGRFSNQYGVPSWSFDSYGSVCFNPPIDQPRSTLQILGSNGIEVRVTDEDSNREVDTIEVVRHYPDGISRILQIRNLPGKNATATFCGAKPDEMFEGIVSDTEGTDPFQKVFDSYRNRWEYEKKRTEPAK
ncbi:hypothetical protein HYU13_05590 [Candidatus Woesearchaeota archaeon]|nr:hypothetical protein [Candidatus Woesearchaeota archaeon]